MYRLIYSHFPIEFCRGWYIDFNRISFLTKALIGISHKHFTVVWKLFLKEIFQGGTNSLQSKKQYLSEFKMFVAIEHKLDIKPVLAPQMDLK